VATDNGTPAATATQSFTVIVRDTKPDLLLTIGATNLLGGQRVSVPLSLDGESALAQLEFTIDVPPAWLSGVALENIATDVLLPSILDEGEGRYRLQFAFTGGNAAILRPLASIAFTAATNFPSAILSLRVTSLFATRSDTSIVTNAGAINGEAIVVTREPVLTVRQSPSGAMTLFGPPGHSYVLDQGPTINGPWTQAQQTTAFTGVDRWFFDFGATQRFYRVREPNPTAAGSSQ
jgi:hypothetical protein